MCVYGLGVREITGNDSTSRDVKIPIRYLARLGSAVIRTDLVDSETYIFSRHALQNLDPTPRQDDGQDATHGASSAAIKSIREDFVPLLIEKQFSSDPNSVPEICTSQAVGYHIALPLELTSLCSRA